MPGIRSANVVAVRRAWASLNLKKHVLGHLITRGLAVASIAQDDPFPLPGMHRDHNAPAFTASAGARGKFGSEFET